MFGFAKNLFKKKSSEVKSFNIGATGMTKQYDSRDPRIPKLTIPRHILLTFLFNIEPKKTFTYKQLIGWLEFDAGANEKAMKLRIYNALNALQKKRIIKKLSKGKWKLLV
jgi:hypothetical protein